MKLVSTIIDQAVGMFIDDGMLALLCAALIVGVAVAVLLLGLRPGVPSLRVGSSQLFGRHFYPTRLGHCHAGKALCRGLNAGPPS